MRASFPAASRSYVSMQSSYIWALFARSDWSSLNDLVKNLGTKKPRALESVNNDLENIVCMYHRNAILVSTWNILT